MTVSLDEARRHQRALGAYYTPSSAAEYLAAWAIRSGAERVLEPSLGGGAFVVAVRNAAHSLAASPHTVGVELSNDTFTKTMASPSRPDEGICSDFLDLQPTPVDVVIGNPPFVRYRHLPKEQRLAALRAGERALGVPIDTAGSIWLPFVAHATRFMTAGGRLALVLPLEATYVRYARGLWRFLTERFGSVRVLRVKERIFPDILQDVILLLADGAGLKSTDVRFEAYETFADLVVGIADAEGEVSLADIEAGRKPFTRALLPQPVAELLTERLDPASLPAAQRVKFNIGYVTGDKHFFHPTTEVAAQYGLSETSLHPTISSARQLKAAPLRTSELARDRRTQLYLPTEKVLGGGERRYNAHGERTGVDQRYKSRIRDPWFITPHVKAPDVVLTVFSDRPVLAMNDARLFASNSLLCGYSVSTEPLEQFTASWYTPLTPLSIELAVHSLGGGVLILVPGEADAVRLAKVPAAEGHLENIDASLRSGDTAGAYASGGAALRSALGLTRAELDLIEQGRQVLAHWRSKAGSPKSAEEVDPDVPLPEGLD